MTAADSSAASAASSSSGPSAAARGRSMLGIVLVLLLGGGTALLWSSSMVWATETIERETPMPPMVRSLGGADAVPMTVGAGFILLAAVVAVLATRVLGRRLIAVAVLAALIATAVQLIGWWGQSDTERSAALADGEGHSLSAAPDAAAAALPLAVAGVLLALVAAVVLLTVKNLPMMGSKYERRAPGSSSATTSPDPQVRDRDMWSSLDRGEDPTHDEKPDTDAAPR